MNELRVRRSLDELQDQYLGGNKKALDDLMRAWKGVKELPADDPRSFFVLGGYHGEPFRGAGWGTACTGVGTATTATSCFRRGTVSISSRSRRRCRASPAART